MTPDADVFQGSTLVAHISRTAQGTALSFVPDAELANGFLASTLSRKTEPIETPYLHPFFLNLLPEGARLKLLLQAARSKEDSLALLLKVGWDTIGDIAVLPHGEPEVKHTVSVSETRLQEANFWELFYQGIEGADASIPGIQEKISASTIAFGVKTASVPSAILKLNPRAYPRLVQNEAFFLAMAKSCGLEVNRASVVYDRKGEPGLLVTRFDRVKRDKAIHKLHQEDACQLLDEVPANKYEIPLKAIAEATSNVCTSPIAETLRLLRLYAFSYIIGNGDLHAKNISVYWHEAVRLTPAYDLISTLPYPMDQNMALKLDGRDDNFRASNFAAFGERFGVRKQATRSMIDLLCTRAESWIGRVGEIGFEQALTERMQREIADRIAKLRR
jgi:serine/threonine-protein kinase HipA